MLKTAPRREARRAGPARVLIVDDHDLAREGLRSLLSRSRDLEVVAEADGGEQAVRVCERLRPDLVLMDVRMPGMDGLDATAAITRTCPATRVVIISMYENRDYLFKALRAGAAGYLLKGASRQQILDTLRQVLRGKSVVEAGLAMRSLQSVATQNASGAGRVLGPELSARELEVLRLLAKGLTNRAIGSALQLSVNTIKIHVVHVLAKLGVTDRTQAAVAAVELGLLDVY